ncbi:persulfide dioxygenase ETHE1, mitochondrial [Eurytemora carolleeae]|uniref:persulfide dioxygenase ETHE1, mitochondrial n=1 Tax=Eurytemora carolleeae TaxID=1294199 RepID=UPI000C778637|nr:persulfide dioxygenase ETHE1, mitochondrial [Eurytemora carolleeae]|eukprot:XP_023330785.1 persulfide dioxygenase ETHE1, mitochondrial-like [Eurytemora affinis]
MLCSALYRCSTIGRSNVCTSRFLSRAISSNMFDNLMLRQLFDNESSTYSYLLVDKPSREAILIDPVIEKSERDAKLVEELDLKLKKAEAQADLLLGHGEKLKFGEQELEIAETPGHTAGCVTYIHHGAGCAFTGDALLIRGCGRTDFQGGSAETLYSSVWNNILSLPDSYNLYPAHDYKGQTVTTVGEEKKFNPRLTKTVDEFVKIMGDLNLPYPKKIDESLPANLVCGLHNLPERMNGWV